MRTAIFTWSAAAAIFMTTASVSAAPADVKKQPVAPSRARKIAPLTAYECMGLGGANVPTTECGSGVACETADKNGVVRRACIDGKKN